MRLNNQSGLGNHPPQEQDPQSFDAARPNTLTDEFFPAPENLGVQENREIGGAVIQGRRQDHAQLPNGEPRYFPEAPVRQDAQAPTDETPCPQGQEKWNGQCVDKCPAGYVRQSNGQCQPPATEAAICPDGQEQWNGRCVDKCPAGEIRDLKDGVCKPNCNSTALENASPGDIVPPGYGPLIENRSRSAVNFTAEAAYYEHSQDWESGSGEIKITVSAAATPVNVRYLAWGKWDTWMAAADGLKARNPIPVERTSIIEGQKFNWHDAWKNNQTQVAVIWNETGAVAFRWPSEASRAAPVAPTDATLLPHDQDYQPPAGSVEMEMWNGHCVPKCGPDEHRDPETGDCQKCPPGQSWNGYGCEGRTEPPAGGSDAHNCPAGQYWDGNACVNRPVVTLSKAWGNNTIWCMDYTHLPSDPAFNLNILNVHANPKTFDPDPVFKTLHQNPPFKILRGMNAQNMNSVQRLSGAASVPDYNDIAANTIPGWNGSNGAPQNGLHPLRFIELCNALGVMPWVHISPQTVVDNDGAFMTQFGNWCAQATSSKIIVEIGNEPWNAGPPFAAGNTIAGKYAQSQGWDIQAKDISAFDWHAPGYPIQYFGGGIAAASAALAKRLDAIIRPLLGDKLVMVCNAQMHGGGWDWQYAQDKAGYSPDAWAVACYVRGDGQIGNPGFHIAQLGTEKEKAILCRNAANAAGTMLAAYEWGIEQYNGNAGTKSYIESSDAASVLDAQFKQVLNPYFDFGCMYRMMGAGVFGMTKGRHAPDTATTLKWRALAASV